MTKTAETEVPARAKLSIRAGVSRKLLERKAMEAAAAAGEPAGDALEDSFPDEVNEQADPADAAGVETPTVNLERSADGHAGIITDIAGATAPAPTAPATADQEHAETAPEQPTAAQAPKPADAIAWSAEDESAFQTLAARRKAAGYQRRGRDVSDQIVRLGSITPNPNTVVAVIVGLVRDRGGSMTRSDLVAAMAAATYPHGKARPDDKGWCQGYVAGAVRNGFLALADEPVVIANAA